MTEPDPPARRTGRPPRTSRTQVLEAAYGIIERDGWEKLTIRRLAAEIGVSTMTLYHHVDDRGDLLVQLISNQLGRLPRPDLPDAPRERILVAATHIHDALAGAPWVAEVITTDGFLSRLDAAALWPVETILGAAIDTGRTPEQAILLFRDIWYYTVGEILVRANTRRRRTDGTAQPATAIFTTPDPATGTRDPAALPTLGALGHLWAEVAQRDTYPQGLEAIVDGLLAQATRT